jgi:uncharacterized membrane protein YphA (DoxX/SURF4 family)
MKKGSIIEIIVLLYVILFLYTGISKLIDYSIFKEQISTSPVLAPIAKPVAILLPWVEFLLVLLLIFPKWRLKGLYASLALMVLFTCYIAAILSFSDRLPCSCGGIIELLSWKQHLLLNSILILLSTLGIMLETQLRKNIANFKLNV